MPVPRLGDIYYYEAFVRNAAKDGVVCIGFSGSTFQLDNLPGWLPGSYGYHSDDGKKFSGTGQGERYGPCFTTGDTVGAGIDLCRGDVFFTMNGIELGTAYVGCSQAVANGLYPTIGLGRQGDCVEVNFGSYPFKFDVSQRAAFNARVRSLHDGAAALASAHHHLATFSSPSLPANVPKAASKAVGSLSSVHGQLLAHSMLLSMVMLPASRLVVLRILSLLNQVLTTEHEAFVQLCRSGGLVKACSAAEADIGTVQHGYELLAAELGILKQEMDDVERQVALSLQAAKAKGANKTHTLEVVHQAAAPATAGTVTAAVGAGAGVALVLLGPIGWAIAGAGLVTGALAGAAVSQMTKALLGGAKKKAEQVDVLEQHCRHASAQLHTVVAVLVASALVTELAMFSSEIRAGVQRVKENVKDVACSEERAAQEARALRAYHKILIRQSAEIKGVCEAYIAAIDAASARGPAPGIALTDALWQPFKRSMEQQLSGMRDVQGLLSYRFAFHGNKLVAQAL